MNTSVPERYAEYVKSLLASVSSAAQRDTHPLIEDEAVAIAATEQPPIAPHSVRHAGECTVHALRIHATRLGEGDDPDTPLWGVILQPRADVIRAPETSRVIYWQQRTASEIEHLPVGGDRWAPLLAKWFRATASGGDVGVIVGHLAREVMTNLIPSLVDPWDLLAATWWAQYGERICARLGLADQAGQAGRAWSEEERSIRALQREAVRGMASARRWSKADIARMCGVARPTVHEWLT